MKKLVILMVFFLLSSALKAQWKQLQDPVLHNNAINSMVYLNGYLYAATNSGLYYSRKDNIHWAHKSLDHYPINQIINIGNTLFVVYAHPYKQTPPQILRSEDMGNSWDTLPAPPVRSNSVGFELNRLGNSLFLITNMDQLGSDDMGNTWHKIPLRDRNSFDFLFYDKYLVREDMDEYHRTAYSYTQNDTSYTPFAYDADDIFFGKETISFQDSAVTYAMHGQVQEFGLQTGRTHLLGKMPVLADPNSKDTFANLLFYRKIGNVHYAGFEFELNRGPEKLILFSSHDDCKSWQRTDSIPNFYTPHTYLAGDSLFIFDGQSGLVLNAHNDRLSVLEPEIDCGMVLQTGDTALLLIADTFAKQIFPHSALNAISESAPEIEKLITYKAPLDIDEDAEHNIEIEGNNISSDNGQSWKPLAFPKTGNSSPKLLAYTQKYILANDGSTLFYSSDAGSNWNSTQLVPVWNVNYTPQAAVHKDRIYVLINDTPGATALRMLMANEQDMNFHNMGDAMHLQDREFIVQFFLSQEGVPVITTTGNNGSRIFTYDTLKSDWAEMPLQGLPSTISATSFCQTKDIIMYSADYLYVSHDLGKTFTVDKGFPAGVHGSNGGALPRIGNTVYMTTSAGIWYNTSLFAAEEDKPVFATFSIYPNPARDNFNIGFTSESSGQAALCLIDMEGRICRRFPAEITKGSNAINVSAENLCNGTYILQFRTDKQLYTRKIVIE